LLSHQYYFVAKSRPVSEIPIDQLDGVMTAHARFILVDESHCLNTAYIAQRAIPFLERDGQYWGHPADDEHAVRELERMRQQLEVEFLVFARPAFWWLEYYSSFALYLDTHFNCLLRNNLVIVFDLRT